MVLRIHRSAAWTRRLRVVLLIGLPALGACPAPSGACPPPSRAYATPAAEPGARDRLVATGQTQGVVGNLGAPGDGNRDDGDLVRGRLPDFAVGRGTGAQADNVVVDLNTGLMWVRSITPLDGTDGLGAHGNVRLDGELSWQAALDAAADLRYAGFDDWRLPNVNELQTIVDFSRAAPALDPAAFPEPFDALPSPYFWSSTTNDRTPMEAFYVNAFDGHVYPWHKAIGFSVRPVRDAGVDDPTAVLQTGQTEGYRGNSGDRGSGNGDDGALRGGLAPDYVWPDDGGAIDTADENVVTDRNTGLDWLRDPLRVDGTGGVGGNQDLSRPVDWQTAVERCNALDYAGHADWRLPNINALVSITRPGRPDASIDPDAFGPPPVKPGDPAVGHVWWSSTSAAVGAPGHPPAAEAWYVGTGAPTLRHHVGPDWQPPKSRPGYVRCVRDTVPRVHHPLYRDEVRSSADFAAVTVAASGSGVERVGKFILPLDPATPDVPFAVAFQDVNQHPLHYDFLRAAFPERFGALTFGDYTALVSPRATRAYLAGGIRSFTTATGARAYGFDVFIDADRDPDLLTAAETSDLHRRLGRVFRRRPLVYSPTQPGAVDRSRAWVNPGFPIDFPAVPPGSDFEAYTTGDAYGTIRRMTLDELVDVGANGRLSWQDIVVLDRAPTDLEGVVAGIVTGDPQGELSHLAIRTARRGTPNAFVDDSHAAFAPYAGRLVRLTVTRDGWAVKADVTPAEAEAWWAARRPAPVAVPAVDVAFDRLDDLAAIAADDAGGRATARVGGKAANLARLYVFLPAEHQVPGFAIPFRHARAFMDATRIVDNLSNPPVERSLSEHVAALHADVRFQTDSGFRAARLAALRDHVEDEGEIPASTVAALAERIEALFGPGTMVRFRSSSNAEDGLVFTGAGLYDSTSVCPADSLDGDTAGPSRCDPGQKNERTIERGLRRVWASLWNFRAAEERAWYGIDPSAVAMAVLVTPAFPDERANGVAFSGNPLSPAAPEYLVNVQLGDTSVVLPDPGVLPERNVLTVDGGRITAIRRAQASSLVTPGTRVVSDAELVELGDVLTLAAERFPLPLDGQAREDIMLDVEFKLRRGDDRLLVKQIRPFLAAGDDTGGRAAALRVEVARPQRLCAMWRIAHAIRHEHAQKMTLDLAGGEITVPLDGPATPAGPFGELRFGPDLALARPLGPVESAVEPVAGRPGLVTARLTRRYAAGRSVVTVTWPFFDIRAGELNVRRFDTADLTTGVVVTAQVDDGSAVQYLAPCGLPHLAAERLEIMLDDGQSATLHMRKGSGGGFWVGYLWAELVRAEVRLAAGRREVTGYRDLVYDAVRHNWDERFMVLFDPPLGDAHGLEVDQLDPDGGQERFAAWTLDADLEPLHAIAVRSAKREQGAEAGRSLYLPALTRDDQTAR